MALKHAISILMSRFSLTYKTLLYAMIVILLFILIGVVVLVPIIKPLVVSANDIGLIDHIKESVNNILKGQWEEQGALYPVLMEDIRELGDLFNENAVAMSLAIVWIIFVLMLFRITMTMCHYPIADVINNFMAYNSRFGFTSNFVSNLGISAKFALSEFIVSIPFYLVCGGVVVGISYLISLFSITLAFVAGFAGMVVVLALKKTLLSFWLPHLIYTHGKVWQTFKEQFALMRHKFVKVFGLYVMTLLLMFAFVAFFGVFTFTIGWYLGYSVCVVLCRIIDMVIYYRDQNHKYYIEPKTVIDAKSEIL